MTLPEELTARVVGLVRQHLPDVPADQPLDPGADLAALGLDSLAMVSLLVDVEESFKISFPEELLRRSTFSSVDTLLSAIRTVAPR